MAFTEQEMSEFITEAQELIDAAEKSLLALDLGGEFQTNFDAIFRCFHSLKGAAGMMELERLQAWMHQLESTLIRFKDTGSIPKSHIDYFLRGADGALQILKGADPAPLAPPAEAAPAPAPAHSNDALAEFLVECDEISVRLGSNFAKLEKSPGEHSLVDAIYRDIHSLKGGAQLMGYALMGKLAHAMESSLEPVRERSLAIEGALADLIFRGMDLLDRMVAKIRAGEPLGLHAEVDALTRGLAGLPAPVAAQQPVIQPVPPAVAAAVAVVAAHAPAPAPVADTEASTVRVPVGLLDKLMTLMGEMVLVRNQVLQHANQSDNLEFLNLSQRLNVVTGELQGEMMKTRMQPIGNVVSKFTRVVRDLARELGKRVELTISGAETELDKTLLEAVKDPLTHIIRNSCDHGIETPEERRAAGKPETGNVSLRAFHESGQVIIEIKDDGRGLSRDKLVRKALERGILTQERAAAMSERESFGLIFAPGFSTAAAVTNVSGRGVGMDVVRNNVERIGGSIEIDSEPGKGMSIRLKIPLTLAIVPAMIVRCGEDRYAIPQLKLVELVRVEREAAENRIEYLQGKPVYRLRGNILPLLDLKGVLGMGGDALKGADAINIVVLNAESQCFGLIVDEILDTADIVVKPLSRFLKSLTTYSGATVLGDGSVALILDTVGIAQQAQLGLRKSVSTQREETRVAADSQEFLLFRLNSGAKHAIVLGYVHRLEEFKRSQLEYTGSQAVVRYRGAILPIVSLNRHLGYPETAAATPNDVLPVVVIQRGEQYYGIEVNEILDVLSTAANVDTQLTDRPGILGTFPTEQEVIVVVDPQTAVRGATGKTEQTMAKRSAAPVRILFVEDTAFFRKHVSNMLSEAGHEVMLATNGAEALRVLDETRDTTFDLIISDIEMPHMNGFELARAVRKLEKWKKTPMMALTTRSEQRSVDKGLQAGFDIYMEKISPPQLLEAVNELASRRTRGVA